MLAVRLSRACIVRMDIHPWVTQDDSQATQPGAPAEVYIPDQDGVAHVLSDEVQMMVRLRKVGDHHQVRSLS